MKNEFTDLRNLFYLLVATLVGILYCVATPMLDDYWFSLSSEGQETWGERLEWLGKMTAARRLTDNWRLANVLGPVFLAVFPRWVFSALTGAAVFLIFRISDRIAKVGAGSLRSWIWVAVFILVFPWYDGVVCVMFSLNYVWATLTTLVAVLLFFRRGKAGAGACAAACAAGFAAGWMHEGFSLPLICGMCAVMVFERLSGRAPGRRRVFLLAGTLAGFCLIVSSPSIWNRGAESQSKILEMPWHEILIQAGPSLALAAMYAATLVAAIRRRGRIEGADVFFGVATACALAVELKFFGGARVGWPTELYATIGSLRLWGEWPSRTGRVAGGIMAVIALAVLGNLVAAVRLQRRLTAEAATIAELYMKSADGTVYYDAIRPEPDFSLLKTSVMQFHQRVPTRAFQRYYDPSKTLTLLPTVLRDFPSGAEAASRPEEGIHIYKGHIVVRPESLPAGAGLIVVRTSGGAEVESRFRQIPFVGADGLEYIYIVPHVALMDPGLEISGARFD